MRIGTPFIQEQFLTNLRRIDRDLADALGRMSSGKRVIDASDDPQAAAELVRLEDRFRLLTVRESGSGRANTFLAHTEEALSALGRYLEEALVDAVQGANETFGSTPRIALAEGISQLEKAVRGLASTRVDGTYIFSGTRTTTPPYDVAGAYQGNGVSIEIPLDEGTVAVNMPGNIVFGEVGGGGALDVLNRLRTALLTDNPDAVAGVIGEIKTLISQNGARLASIGARRQRVDDARVRIANETFEVKRRMSELADADYAEAFSDAQRLQVGYQAALQSGARLFGPTFFDFLG